MLRSFIFDHGTQFCQEHKVVSHLKTQKTYVLRYIVLLGAQGNMAQKCIEDVPITVHSFVRSTE